MKNKFNMVADLAILTFSLIKNSDNNHYDVRLKEPNKLIGILNRNDPACYVFFSKSVQ